MVAIPRAIEDAAAFTQAAKLRVAVISDATPERNGVGSYYADLVAQLNRRIGKAELDNFIDPESDFPVIATTSELMSTGVDAKTCKVIVLDKTINSMTMFKQIIARDD